MTFARRKLLLAQRHARLRSEPEWSIPDSPIGIAAEMARLVLEMRDNGRNAGVRKQRLELLAEGFLRITGHKRESDCMSRFESANRTAAGVTVTM